MSDANQGDEQAQKIIDDNQEPTTKLEKENQEAAAEIRSQDKNGELSMDVKVYSPFKNYFEGKAFSVSTENLTGPFDILPRHHNFISLLSASSLIIRSAKGEEKIEISGGIMHVKADKLIVFLDV